MLNRDGFRHPEPHEPQMWYRRSWTVPALILSTAVFGCATQRPGVSDGASMGAYEDNYVLRSEREERTPNSTWCTAERAGFAPVNARFLLDDRFAMWSTQVQAVDGRMVHAKATRHMLEALAAIRQQ